MTFYNTIKYWGEQLAKAEEDTLNQDERIFLFFYANSHGLYTPFDIQEAVLPRAPVTSVRRSMTNLTDRGVLEKTEAMKQGRYGKANHLWRLIQEGQPEQISLL